MTRDSEFLAFARSMAGALEAQALRFAWRGTQCLDDMRAAGLLALWETWQQRREAREDLPRWAQKRLRWSMIADWHRFYCPTNWGPRYGAPRRTDMVPLDWTPLPTPDEHQSWCDAEAAAVLLSRCEPLERAAIKARFMDGDRVSVIAHRLRVHSRTVNHLIASGIARMRGEPPPPPLERWRWKRRGIYG